MSLNDNEMFLIIKILDFYESNTPKFEDSEVEILYNIRQKITKPIDEKLKKHKERIKKIDRFFNKIPKDELNDIIDKYMNQYEGDEN